MSDETRELLVKGMAAARAGDKEEARFYLEWSLRTDADFEQQADAWYWLSTAIDDPQEKRDFLQNVLAVVPNYPEARRDLAILDGRLDPSQVLPETRRDLAPIQLASTVQPGQLHRFKCPRCGGMTVFQPGAGVLACQFCGFRPGSDAQPTSPIANSAPSGGLPDQDWVAAIYTRKGHIWQLPTARSLRCEGCGANVTLPPSGISMSCPFCGSPYLVIDNTARQLIQPEGVLPFEFDRDGAVQRFRSWLGGQPYTPADLYRLETLEPPRPVYLPIWDFNVTGEAHWQGFVIEDEYGKKIPVRTDGLVPVLFDDVVISGSKSPGTEQVSSLKFKVGDAVPYDEKYLANWPAEIYSISLSDAAVLAHEQTFKRSQVGARLHASAVPGVDNVEVDRVEIEFVSYKHLLVAVWLCNYNYKGKRYSLVIDGNGGDVTGEVPRAGVNKLLNRIFASD